MNDGEHTNLTLADGNIAIGCEATQLALTLPRINPSIEVFTFNSYFPYPGLQERFDESAEHPFREAPENPYELKRGTVNDIPYWESLLINATMRKEEFSFFVQEALRHDPVREFSGRFEIPVTPLTPEFLQAYIDELPDGKALALCSKCKLRDGSDAHIPMMDFRCQPSPENLERIKEVLAALDQRNGAILESGRSYHFYGFNVMDQGEWVEFLARCLLLHPFTDSRYIAHRLIGGTCALRITATKLKPKIPIVVALI